ncbi:MAG: TIGR04282 family arsenosugar biosynthesis glycosyltransferase [Promethearchaeota archaeon]
MNKNALIILLRNPRLGCVKTRLAAKIGDEGALKVYNALLEYTRTIACEINSSRLLFYSNFIDNNDSWDEGLFTKFLQEGNSFGVRMCRAFKAAFKEHNKAVIIGSDCLELTSDIIENAFNKLNNFEVVIGPAKDGGYYLLGLKKIYPELFLNKEWSTSSVLSDTLEDIKKLGINYYLLPVLSDIDNFEDFKNSNLFEKVELS